MKSSLLLLAPVVLSAALAAQSPKAEAEAAIMKADAEFNQAVATRNRERFLSFLTDTAVFNGGTPNEWRGRDEIMKGWSLFFSPNGPTLTWHPIKSEVLVGVDVGYSIGSWVRRTPGADGKVTEMRGQYVTTWLKQPDGSWKVVFDIGSTQPPGEPPGR
jgi:ketosteroid isomerase-like protein